MHELVGAITCICMSVTKNAGNNARDKAGDTSAIIIKSVKLLQSVGVQGFQGGPET